MMSMLRIAAVALLLVAAAGASPILFTFDTDVVGKNTQFTDTVGGLSATFSGAAADPGAFGIASLSNFQTLTGNVLIENAFNAILTISFDSPLSGISLLFATLDVVPIQLSAFLDGTPVGTPQSVSGTVPNGFMFPEGTISFVGGIFNQIQLAANPQFVIDNVSATLATGVPEPASIPLIGLGLAVICGLALKRQYGRG